MNTKICGYCEKEFIPIRAFQKYCSKTCQDKFNLSQRRYGGNHYAVLKRDHFMCQECGSTKSLHVHHKDEVVSHTSMDNLITLCQVCHIRHHSAGEENNHYKFVGKRQIEHVIESTSSLEEAAKILGVTRSTLRKKRMEYGLPQLSSSRPGKENKTYIELSMQEIEMAYELEGTWVKAAERLGVSDGFLRKRYKELRGLDHVRNRIYKDITKEQIEEAYAKYGNWKGVYESLGVTKKTLLSKRKMYGMM